MAGLRCRMRRLGYPQRRHERRICVVVTGGALAVSGAGVGVGLLCWWARGSGEYMALEMMLAGMGAAFVTGAGATTFGPGRIVVEARFSRRIPGAALAGWIAAVLCALGSMLGVLAAAMHEAGQAGAAAVAGQMSMLALACLAALAVGCVCCGWIAVRILRQGRKGSCGEGAR